MITEAMLDVFCRFDGDVDGFARIGTAEDRSVISGEQWTGIDVLLQELHLAKANLASPEYATNLEQRLCATAENDTVKERLWELA
ncbi:hypothetical protein [Oleiagrimonas sp. C23AA]|uniref:hypothetical protein n=1 Tax=Oleiagrimonas sp. C23AA TaxID=2719047 RepID=UPI0014205C4E|nr:hypothetical protein [Oleiagrimonas sp. C23AA]NII10141.1 hypothetical protein [Oleiagrimonas sp. C23AA]